jgi:two-component system, NtrC family, nitrogen regulation sensor histidine kinase GlnL
MKPTELAQTAFAGLELLSSAVVLVDANLSIRHANPAAENLFAISRRTLLGMPLARVLGRLPELEPALRTALDNNWSYSAHNLAVNAGDGSTHHIDCTVSPVDVGGARLLLEMRPIDQQLKAAREEQLAQQQQVSRELVRNLAHEIKNPLGGIRGSAQLLEREFTSCSNGESLTEYTQVIIKETDRLQALMKRLLSSHRMMQPALVDIHEILERVRSLIHAEFTTVRVRRDYDLSLPEITGDREQLIQAILNIARNAAQALMSQREPTSPLEISFRTRPLRQVTLAKRHYRLALALQVIDNGPGIPEELRERIFYPLVSGRENGSGLGLTLAQSFVQQHGGSIDLDSRPGHTCFTLHLPITSVEKAPT